MNNVRIKDLNMMSALCKGWKETETYYELTSTMDEYIVVYKQNGDIDQYGYNGLLQDWIYAGYVEIY